MAATTTAGTVPGVGAEERMDPRKLIAFFAMVLGMKRLHSMPIRASAS